jgi:hypothetical protein
MFIWLNVFEDTPLRRSQKVGGSVMPSSSINNTTTPTTSLPLGETPSITMPAASGLPSPFVPLTLQAWQCTPRSNSSSFFDQQQQQNQRLAVGSNFGYSPGLIMPGDAKSSLYYIPQVRVTPLSSSSSSS